jgi:hypothetical protein
LGFGFELNFAKHCPQSPGRRKSNQATDVSWISWGGAVQFIFRHLNCELRARDEFCRISQNVRQCAERLRQRSRLALQMLYQG